MILHPEQMQVQHALYLIHLPFTKMTKHLIKQWYPRRVVSPLSSFDPSLPFNTRIPSTTMDFMLRYIPLIMPVLAYFIYEETAKMFNGLVFIEKLIDEVELSKLCLVLYQWVICPF